MVWLIVALFFLDLIYAFLYQKEVSKSIEEIEAVIDYKFEERSLFFYSSYPNLDPHYLTTYFLRVRIKDKAVVINVDHDQYSCNYPDDKVILIKEKVILRQKKPFLLKLLNNEIYTDSHIEKIYLK